jgi:hypothetical protein
MALPSQPVTITAGQLADLNRKLSNMRHDVNNHVSLIMAAVELLRQKPETAQRTLAALSEQPRRITESLVNFSAEFERTFGISRSPHKSDR